ncbi:MAG: WD40 repeat domain-containing protein [Waterburya sp.]
MNILGTFYTFSPSGKIFVTSKEVVSNNTDKNSNQKKYLLVEIKRMSDGEIIQALEITPNSDITSPTVFTISPDDFLIAAVVNDGKQIQIWRIGDGKLLHSLKGLDNSPLQTGFLSFVNNGKTIITKASQGYIGESSMSSQITVWNLSNGEKHYSLSGKYISAAITSDGQTLALSSSEEPIALYRLSDGKLIKQLEKTSKRIVRLRFSQDGKLLAGILNGGDEGILVYRVEDGQLLRTFSSRIQAFLKKESLVNFALSPDSKHLAASYHVKMSPGFIFDGAYSYPLTSHGRIRVWELDTGKQIQTLRGHKRGTNVLAFTPDGKMLASAGRDGTIRFWKFPPQYPLLVWLVTSTGLVAAVRYLRRWYLLWSLQR